MKIDKKKLSAFLKKVAVVTPEAIFDFTDSGLKVASLSVDNISRVDIIEFAKSFSEYSAIGKIGVQDIKQISTIIDKFEKDVEILVTGNILTFKEASKKVEMELMDVQLMNSINDMKELDFVEILTVPADKLKAFFADANINDETDYKLETTEKCLSISNSGKFKFNYRLPAIEAKGGQVAKYGDALCDIMSQLSGELKISFATEFPIKILEKSEDGIAAFIIAPRIKTEMA